MRNMQFRIFLERNRFSLLRGGPSSFYNAPRTYLHVFRYCYKVISLLRTIVLLCIHVWSTITGYSRIRPVFAVGRA